VQFGNCNNSWNPREVSVHISCAGSGMYVDCILCQTASQTSLTIAPTVEKAKSKTMTNGHIRISSSQKPAIIIIKTATV
jgi:hypothetical protein